MEAWIPWTPWTFNFKSEDKMRLFRLMDIFLFFSENAERLFLSTRYNNSRPRYSVSDNNPLAPSVRHLPVCIVHSLHCCASPNVGNFHSEFARFVEVEHRGRSREYALQHFLLQGKLKMASKIQDRFFNVDQTLDELCLFEPGMCPIKGAV